MLPFFKSLNAAKSLTTSSMELNVGTLNVRGLSKEYAKYALSEDLEKYKRDIVSVQETKIGETFCHTQLTTPTNKTKYDLFLANNKVNHHHGVGIAIKSDL